MPKVRGFFFPVERRSFSIQPDRKKTRFNELVRVCRGIMRQLSKWRKTQKGANEEMEGSNEESNFSNGTEKSDFW